MSLSHLHLYLCLKLLHNLWGTHCISQLHRKEKLYARYSRPWLPSSRNLHRLGFLSDTSCNIEYHSWLLPCHRIKLFWQVWTNPPLLNFLRFEDRARLKLVLARLVQHQTSLKERHFWAASTSLVESTRWSNPKSLLKSYLDNQSKQE